MKPTQDEANLDQTQLLAKAAELVGEAVANDSPAVVIVVVDEVLKFAGINTQPAEMYSMMMAASEALQDAYSNESKGGTLN
jgi:hypothetical protein